MGMGGKWKDVAEIRGLGVWQERTVWHSQPRTCLPAPRWRGPNATVPEQLGNCVCASGLGKPGAPTAGQLGRTEGIVMFSSESQSQ